MIGIAWKFELVLNLSDGVCSDLLVIDSPDSGNTIYVTSECIGLPICTHVSWRISNCCLYMYLAGNVVLHMKESTGDASEI